MLSCKTLPKKKYSTKDTCPIEGLIVEFILISPLLIEAPTHQHVGAWIFDCGMWLLE